MDSLYVLALLAAVGVMLFFSIRGGHKRKLLWEQIAKRYGGAWVARPDPASPERLEFLQRRKGIEVPLASDELRPAVKAFIEGNDGTQSTAGSTVGVVRYPLAAGPLYRIKRKGLLDAAGELFGAQDVSLGDATFDKRFMVCAEDPELTRRVWTPRARELMLERFEGCTVESNATELCFKDSGFPWTDAEDIEALIELLGELGRVDFYGHELLASLEGASFTPVTGPWETPAPPAATLSLEGGEVRFAPVLVDTERVGMQGTITNSASRASSSAKLKGDSLGGDLAPSLIGATLEVTSETIVLRFADRAVSELDAETLRAAAELLSQLATG